MLKGSNNTIVKKGKGLIDSRSKFMFVINSPSNISYIYLASESDATVTVYWGDDTKSIVNLTSNIKINTSHTYNTVNTNYVIHIVSTHPLYCCYPNGYIIVTGNSYYKQPLSEIVFQASLNFNKEAIPDYTIPITFISISNSLAVIDLNRIIVSPNATAFGSYYPSNNVTGTLKLQYDNYPSLEYFSLNGTIKGGQDVYFADVIHKCPALKSFTISYHYIYVNREDVTGLTGGDSLIYAMMAQGTKYYGDYTGIIRPIFANTATKRSISFWYNSKDLTCDISEFTSTDISYFAGIQLENVRNFAGCMFMWNTSSIFRISTTTDAIGNLNSIGNLTFMGTVSNFYIYNYSPNVTLDITKITGYVASQYILVWVGNGLTGDISSLGNNNSSIINITSIQSTALTGWNELVDNLYNNRATSTLKTFNCPTVMKNVLTGTYQAPLGFIKGQSDGNPTTSREKIFVLANNYGKTFTNI